MVRRYIFSRCGSFFLSSSLGRSNIGCYLEDLAKAPGPGHVQKIQTEVYMSKAPHYSLGARNYMPGDKVQKPGPGAHRPENVTINKPFASKHSLGVRHSQFTCPMIPDNCA